MRAGKQDVASSYLGCLLQQLLSSPLSAGAAPLLDPPRAPALALALALAHRRGHRHLGLPLLLLEERRGEVVPGVVRGPEHLGKLRPEPGQRPVLLEELVAAPKHLLRRIRPEQLGDLAPGEAEDLLGIRGVNAQKLLQRLQAIVVHRLPQVLLRRRRRPLHSRLAAPHELRAAQRIGAVGHRGRPQRRLLPRHRWSGRRLRRRLRRQSSRRQWRLLPARVRRNRPARGQHEEPQPQRDGPAGGRHWEAGSRVGRRALPGEQKSEPVRLWRTVRGRKGKSEESLLRNLENWFYLKLVFSPTLRCQTTARSREWCPKRPRLAGAPCHTHSPHLGPATLLHYCSYCSSSRIPPHTFLFCLLLASHLGPAPLCPTAPPPIFAVKLPHTFRLY